MDGIQISGWRQTKSLALLHYLLDRSNHLVDRETLIGTFWHEGNGRAPETSLKVAVHGLRRLLGGAFGAGSRKRQALTIETHGSSYMLRTEGVWYDVAEFERNVSEATHLDYRGAARDALHRRQAAASLYRGEFLTGAGGDWTLRRRQSLVDQYLNVLISLAESDLAARKYHRCISRCLQALNTDPCSERAYQMIMLCHARAGLVGRMHEWYCLCVQTLKSRLDIPPSRETEQLFHQLRMS